MIGADTLAQLNQQMMQAPFESEQAVNYLRKDLSRAFEECYQGFKMNDHQVPSALMQDQNFSVASPQFGPKTDDPYNQTIFTTPRKETTTNSEFYNSEKKSTPEVLFTPLKIPGSSKNDDAYTSNYFS